MKKLLLTDVVLPKGRGNHSSGEERSHNGRMGRGEDAFSAKITVDWKKTLRRIQRITDRQRALGDIPVSFPLHVLHETVKGVKL